MGTADFALHHRLLVYLRIVIAGTSLLGLCGCSTIQVWLGTRIRLEKTPVASIRAHLPQGKAMYPGQRTPLVVRATTPDRKVLFTEGAAKGKILWEELSVDTAIVSVNSGGIVSMPSDPRESDRQMPHLTVRVPSHPELRADLDIPLRYDHDFIADFSGKAGSNGMSGNDGLDGSSGSMGSLDPLNPAPGGDGGDGGNGSDGDDGGAGENARPVTVRLTLRPGTETILQVTVSDAKRTEWFLVDPAGGNLTINANGGPGGAGGSGGRGGRGGSGGIGTPSGSSGRDGLNGRDGFYGPPGEGALITVRYDPRTKPFLSALILASHDGNGKPGPPPAFIEEPIPPLW